MASIQKNSMNIQQFKQLMETIADGWNTRDPKKSVECFTDDAIYMEPPDKQLIMGKDNLFTYFDNPKPMNLVWHTLMFDEEKQTGSGEFTFTIEGREGNHGVVVVELEKGRIKFWREYYQISNLSFDDFISTKNKAFEYKLV